jgi:hypothetical protein
MNAEAPPFPLQIPYTTCVLAYSSFVNIRDILSNTYVQENSATISEINRRTADWLQWWQLRALALSSIKITGRSITMLRRPTIYKMFLLQITSTSCWWMLANLSQNIQCTVPVHFSQASYYNFGDDTKLWYFNRQTQCKQIFQVTYLTSVELIFLQDVS